MSNLIGAAWQNTGLLLAAVCRTAIKREGTDSGAPVSRAQIRTHIFLIATTCILRRIDAEVASDLLPKRCRFFLDWLE